MRRPKGYPLFVVEMMRARQADEQAIAVMGASASGPHPRCRRSSNLAWRNSRRQRERWPSLAAIVGRAFTVEVLAQASERDEDALVSALDELWQRRIIREQGEQAYDFSHDKIREAAQAAVSPVRRRLLHRRVAQALEQVYAANLDAVSGQIATHYELAALPENAISFYQRAATVAQQVYAHADSGPASQQGSGVASPTAGHAGTAPAGASAAIRPWCFADCAERSICFRNESTLRTGATISCAGGRRPGSLSSSGRATH